MDEQKIYQNWLKKGYFKADPTSNKKAYSLLMPPPNLTGELHLGHAMEHSILDALARFKRMQGFDVLLLPGVDHAGLQFEATLDKKLSPEGKYKQKLGREEWLKEAWKFKEEIYQKVHSNWSFMGISADWEREVFTLEDKGKKAVLEEFRRFWDENLLYKGAYIVQWCPKDATAIEDVEMEYEERKEKLYFIKYEIKDLPLEDIVIATARPETIYADTAIAVHPNDERYKKYIGKDVQNPLTGDWFKIIADSRVDKDFGTGALKITPGHDPLDYAISQDQKPQPEIKHAIDKNGKMTSQAYYGSNPEDTLEGMKVAEAREKTIEILEEKGSFDKPPEDYTHSVPVCERCKTTIEPLISEEWFVKMDSLAKKALDHLKEINFYPKNYQKILADWLKEIHDWSISRSLWWGHQIPVWYCQKSNPNHQVGKDKDLIISLDKPNTQCSCGANDWVQDEQVLDTWFSSGMWPLATLGWPEKTSELEKYFPFSFETSAPEIKYLWIARMIMLSLHFQDSIPFKNQFFHGMMRDLKGQKFSKSLGNGIDPLELTKTWGTDSVRMTLYSYSAPGRDSRVSRQLMDERTKNFRNFSTKLKNLFRFIIELKPERAATEMSNHQDDQKIMAELEKLTESVTKNLDSFNLHLASDALYNFIWHELADQYVEQSKNRRTEAQPTLEHVFKTCLELLHPFMPFITEELWQKLPHQGESIMVTSWPKI